MGFERVQKIADTVLLEGYVLYPYRATSAKNRYRWTFGVLAPRRWSEAGGCEPWWLEARCLVAGESAVTGRLRFLRVVERRVEAAAGDGFVPVAELEADGTTYVPWEEGEIREIDFRIPQTLAETTVLPFSLPPEEEIRVLKDGAGKTLGRVIWSRRELRGVVQCEIEKLEGGLRKIRVRVENLTAFHDLTAPRAEAVRSSFCSTHVLLQVESARFVSLTDPPENAREAAAGCVNVGTYPVLAGDDTLLCSPIILYDDPQLAPESPGDFFDACEIDELLALRTMTLTPDEKKLARATDARSAAIVDRVEAMPNEAMARLHGAIRDRPKLERGARVRLRLGKRRTDAQDLLYSGRAAIIEEVKEDLDGRECFAVTFEGDPAAELHRWYGRYHYYYADEVEPLGEGEQP